MDPFEVMAEPVRRRLVEVLASGEHTAGELAAAVGAEFRVSRTAISKHLRVLRDADFVGVVGDQQWRWYYLKRSAFDGIDVALAELREKMAGAAGYDHENRCDHDPLAGLAQVKTRGPARKSRRGMRGRQTERYFASEPDLGLFPVYPTYLPPWPDEPASHAAGIEPVQPRIDG
ncbi:ArsR/SmtB family transcription factor [Microbacterium sp. MC2]